MGSHSVTFQPTQVNTPHLNPSWEGQHLIYLPRRERRLSYALKTILLILFHIFYIRVSSKSIINATLHYTMGHLIFP